MGGLRRTACMVVGKLEQASVLLVAVGPLHVWAQSVADPLVVCFFWQLRLLDVRACYWALFEGQVRPAVMGQMQGK